MDSFLLQPPSCLLCLQINRWIPVALSASPRAYRLAIHSWLSFLSEGMICSKSSLVKGPAMAEDRPAMSIAAVSPEALMKSRRPIGAGPHERVPRQQALLKESDFLFIVHPG